MTTEKIAIGSSAARAPIAVVSDATAHRLKAERRLLYAKRGLLLGALSGAFWGLDGVLLGLALLMSPFSDASSSLFIAPLVGACVHDGGAAFWLFLHNVRAGRGRELLRSLRVRPGLIVCLAAVMGGPVAMSAYLLGIRFAGTAYVLAITAIYPALGAVFAMLFLREKVSVRAWVGIATCIAGSFVVGYAPPAGNEMPYFYWGIALAVLAALGWALEGVVSAYAMDLLDPEVAINIRQATSFVVYLVGVLPAVGGMLVLRRTIASASGALLLLTAFCGAISYLCWYKAMNMTGVSRAMALNITFALWGIVFGVVLADLRLTPTLVAGAVLVAFGAMLVVANPREITSLRS